MFHDIFKNKILEENKPIDVIGITKQVQAAYVWNLFDVTKKGILVVTNTLYEANMLYKLFPNEADSVVLFPMDDFLVSEALAASPDLMTKRIETINELVHNNNKIVITNLMGYLRFLPQKELWQSLKLDLSVSQNINREDLIKKLNMMGYSKESVVTKTGEYASRGYILDIFAYGSENPVRIEFFDDEIDNIRFFNAENQLSIEKTSNISIYPFTEFINEKQIEDLPIRQSLLPRVVNRVSSLKEYIDDGITIFDDLENLKRAYEVILDQTIEFKEKDTYIIDKYMHELIDIMPNKYINMVKLDNYVKNSNIKEVYDTKSIDSFNGNMDMLNNYLRNCLKEDKTVILCFNNKKEINGFTSKTPFKINLLSDFNFKKGVLNIIINYLVKGFEIDKTVFLTSNEIYNKVQATKYKSSFKYGSKIKDINKLHIGDYVVHASHGVGKYLGIVTLTVKNMKKDYLHIAYKGEDKLYIPVEKIEYINKYSSNEGTTPKLNKLGGTEWAKQKAKVKGKVANIAKELLETSAKRKLATGFSFLPDDEDQIIFENKFEYKETVDQLKAIREIKEDMEMPFPMDRLLCGDVGYGKTEVAFRAIFKAIKSGKQVAFLCPTTILSKQHYNNAVKRFEGFGINIAVLNRFITPKEKDHILKDLKNGKIDLIIGTHRLFSDDVVYKDLGLLVIDEEQRFGVTHKEKIKKYKENIDVLTLSATPIPRTLQMSLTGVRGLSLIETPPAFRYPVQTYVLKENDQIIKDAIYKELARDGQVFVLYNNVSKIEDKLSYIRSLVPEADITYVHGQMNKEQIEKTMELFVDKKYNVLICTTIIETGIDIENANTLIVLDADFFGLSQLYQIRGRIGRGKNIAYAYLMYKKNKELNDIAVKRLNAIKEFTELGSGYALAVRDLSIRGAGDILGSEQSGFIDTIGYEMYLRILNEEVARLKGEEIEEDDIIDEKPLVQVSTHISDKYADTEDLKIEIHKKINEIDGDSSFEKIKEELTDRFGNLDEDIIIYMLEELFQVKSKKKDVFKVEQTDKKVVVYFNNKSSENIDGLELLSGLFRINPSFEINYLNNILRIGLPLYNLDKHFLHYLNEMLDIIE